MTAFERLRSGHAAGQRHAEVEAARVDQRIVLVDEELVIGDPPRVVCRDQEGDVAGQGFLDDRCGEALNAVEVHEIGFGQREDLVEGVADLGIEGPPIHVRFGRRRDPVHGASPIAFDPEGPDRHPCIRRAD